MLKNENTFTENERNLWLRKCISLETKLRIKKEEKRGKR